MALPIKYQKQLDSDFLDSKQLVSSVSLSEFFFLNKSNIDIKVLKSIIKTSIEESSKSNNLSDKDTIKRYAKSIKPISYKDRDDFSKFFKSFKHIARKNLKAYPDFFNKFKIISYNNFDVKFAPEIIEVKEGISNLDFLSQLELIQNPATKINSGDYIGTSNWYSDISRYVSTKENTLLKNIVQANVVDTNSKVMYNDFQPEHFDMFYSPAPSYEELEKAARSWFSAYKFDMEMSGFYGNYNVYRQGGVIKVTDFDFNSINSALKLFNSKMIKDGHIKSSENASYFDKQRIEMNDGEMVAMNITQNKIATVNRPNNKFVEDMLKAGPSLYSNMFDVYLRFNIGNSAKNNENNEFNNEAVQESTYFLLLCPFDKYEVMSGKTVTSTLKPNRVMKSLTEDVYSLSVRTASVSVPLPARETSQINFVNTKYEVVGSTVTMSGDAELSIDMDANSYIYDIFMTLSGFRRRGLVRTSESSGLEDNKFPFMAPAKLGLNGTSIDLIVSVHSLSPWYGTDINPAIDRSTQNDICYVFEDVRFLGISDSIKFDKNDASSMQLSVPFIYKQLRYHYKVDSADGDTLYKGNDNSVFYDRSSLGLTSVKVMDENAIKG